MMNKHKQKEQTNSSLLIHDTNSSLHDTDKERIEPDVKTFEEHKKMKTKSFLEQIKESNTNVICTSSNPQTLTFADLLQRTLRIPIFQRRYAWSTANWSQTLNDVFRLADRTESTHFFGRMTCVVSRSPSTLVVLDGQQRSTTLTLLLAACRDIAEKNRSRNQVNQINRLLLFGSKLKRADFVTMSVEEICAECCRLVPTICDRDPYIRAVLPHCYASKLCKENSKRFNRLSLAKQFFAERLQLTNRTSESKLQDIINAVISKIQWLLFPLDIGGREDGTQHLGVIFQRLALREAMWTRPTNRSMYAEMSSVDFVRNLLLGGFVHDESVALKMYKSHWLVIEREANAIGKGSGEHVLERMIRAYLDAHDNKGCKTTTTKTTGTNISSA